MRADYRIGIDLGTNSLGWCVFDLTRNGKPRGIRRMGVRIFSDGRDPQSGTSLAAERRMARGQRRRRDRYLDRRTDLMKALVRCGLMPVDQTERKKLESLDPYELRTRGLDEKLSLHELGRALFHLNQRRGFKSNRKTDRPTDPEKLKEAENMKGAAIKLAGAIEESGCRTLGEYLFKTAREGRSPRGSKDGSVQPHLAVRARPHTVKNRNAYDFYPTRAMYEHEFDALWAAQAKHHPDLTKAARDEIKDIVFYQRPLKPVDPGKCTLDPTDKRAPLALPIVQQFRILQELANLRLENPITQQARRLTMAERNNLFEGLQRRDRLPFKTMCGKKHLNLGNDWKVNLEEAGREYLKGDIVSKQLSDDKCFGARWFDFPERQQTEIVDFLFDEPDEAAVVKKGVEEWGLSEAQAHGVANIGMPDGYGRLGLNALRKIVPIMREQMDEKGEPLHYSEAAERAGYDHSDFRDGVIWDELPYYGEVLSRYVADVKSPSAPPEEREYGRIANPTVHIGLNETRKLVNKLIGLYGHPAEIVVELARDLKLNNEQKDKIKKEQAANRKKNEERRRKLEEIGESHRTDGILRLRLWEELGGNPADRRCVYTGEQISINRLFSDEVEIEHILPFQDVLDDSPANLTVSLRRANREKGKRSPYEAFGHTPQWDDMVKRATAMPPNKRWRFKPDAMDLVRDRVKRDLARLKGELPQEVLEDIERTGGFLARQLIDTAYLARVARQYLWTVCNPNKVRVVPGRLTEFLRRKWGLNRLLYGNRPAPDEEGASGFVAKRRDDHRHHAIDAFVIGLTELSILQRVSAAAAQARDRLIENMPEPWEGFRDDLKARLDRLIVSYRPEHGVQGKLHEETAYRIVDENTLVYRKALTDLNAKEIGHIRDPKLRADVMAAMGGLVFDETAIDRARTALAEAKKQKDGDAIASAKAEIARLKAAKKEQTKSGTKDLKVALADFAAHRGIRHVRILKTESAYVPIGDGNGHPYKALSTGDNQRVEIYELSDRTWRTEVISVFDSNQEKLGRFSPYWHTGAPDARQITVLFKNDLVRLAVNGQDRAMRIASIWEKYLQLAPHNETNLAERYRSGEFKWTFANYDKLKELGVRKISVDVLGRVHDPGPPK
jgi:CRISPR-associated endonuclease Csn1